MAVTDGKCNCGEGFIQRAHTDLKTRERKPAIRAPLVHDCDYITTRNSLISVAELMVRQSGGKDADFIRIMDELYQRSQRALMVVS